MPEDEEDLTPAQELLIHRNAQAASVILNFLNPEEFNKVDQLDEAKEIWDMLRIAHEGSRGIRESKIELLEGKLGRFVMEDDETPQEMYDRMMVIVNKIHGLGSEDMTDHVVVKRLLREISPRNPTLVTLIRESSGFKRMTPSDVFSSIISHELLEEEAKEVKKYATNAAQAKSNEVAFKANKTNSKLQEESSSDSESEDEELALLVHKFKKFLRKKSYGRKDEDRYKRQSNKTCYECKEFGHFIANCPKLAKNKEGNGKTKYFKKRPKRAHIGEECKPALIHIAKLMKVLEEKEGSLERQEDLFIQERIKNDSLEKVLAGRDKKLVDLSKELTLANQTITNLKDVNEILEETIVSMNVRHNGLENEIDNLKHNLSNSKDNTIVHTILDCEKCKTIDLSVVDTNNATLKELKKENERLETLVKFGCIRTYQSKDALFKTITSYNNKDKRGLGYSPDSNASPKRVIINGKPCDAFVKERESTAEEDTKISPEDRQSEQGQAVLPESSVQQRRHVGWSGPARTVRFGPSVQQRGQTRQSGLGRSVRSDFSVWQKGPAGRSDLSCLPGREYQPDSLVLRAGQSDPS
ncbi:uncharacterized protein LOC121054429 [Oryza brachyantha]|uniref:uncharacterized protein LOC121054429 n=1 Tax=Oryza brachyantha TaxID=4533 RepID=UPI001ADB992E|nr:uncharacterized protein LOC121054429 [Oryza brachyantha]